MLAHFSKLLTTIFLAKYKQIRADSRLLQSTVYSSCVPRTHLYNLSYSYIDTPLFSWHILGFEIFLSMEYWDRFPDHRQEDWGDGEMREAYALYVHKMSSSKCFSTSIVHTRNRWSVHSGKRIVTYTLSFRGTLIVFTFVTVNCPKKKKMLIHWRMSRLFTQWCFV